jgi:hypothetical protein
MGAILGGSWCGTSQDSEQAAAEHRSRDQSAAAAKLTLDKGFVAETETLQKEGAIRGAEHNRRLARKRLEQLIARYPRTEAANAARKVRKQLCGG